MIYESYEFDNLDINEYDPFVKFGMSGVVLVVGAVLGRKLGKGGSSGKRK